MKKILLILFLAVSALYSLPIDTSLFSYYPLNVGNRWTWQVQRNFSPGPGYESLVILTTQVSNNHLYYVGRYDSYVISGNQHTFWDTYYRIDSLNGGLYSYDFANFRDCLLDSLNSGIGDSALVGCTNPEWYRYDTSSCVFLGQHYLAKTFTMNFSHGWGNRIYAKNIGRVNAFGQVLMSQTTTTLRGCIINGQMFGDTNVYLAINQVNSEIPEKFTLSQNYPNPFNPTTNIGFRIAEFGFASLKVYDAIGREVQALLNQELNPGIYEVDFDGSNLPSGVYYYKIEFRRAAMPEGRQGSSTGSFFETKKMVLIK